jgi:hypothetical protein
MSDAKGDKSVMTGDGSRLAINVWRREKKRNRWNRYLSVRSEK